MEFIKKDMKYTTKEVANIFGVTRGTMARWAKKGLVKAEFKKNKWYFTREQIQELKEIKSKKIATKNKISLPTVTPEQYKEMARLSKIRNK